MQISERRFRPREQASPALRFAHTAPQVKDVLFVDPDVGRLQDLLGLIKTVESATDVEGYQDFQNARKRLLRRRPDLLVTNLRLGEYNGLHLVYLVAGTNTRCLVHSGISDGFLQKDAKEAGAFYEPSARLLRVLTSYVHAILPERDRRDPVVLDRRQVARGGRRCSDS